MKFQLTAFTAMTFMSSTVLFTAETASAFTTKQQMPQQTVVTSTELAAVDRRGFAKVVAGTAAAGIFSLATNPQSANAQVFFDPAMYGDQELRVGTVDTVRERTRRAILQNPSLAVAFYQLALLDALSFDSATSSYGPNGGVIFAAINSKSTDEYTTSLRDASQVLIQCEKDLKRKTAVSIADCVAIAGAESIESIGGPVLAVQLGRMEPDKNKPYPINTQLPLDLFSGTRPNAEIRAAFRKAGLTEREMTALMAALLTLERVEKTRTADDWKQSAKPKFVERGKMGRMSDYKRLTDEDFLAAQADEFDEDPDDGWYIVDSFGDRDSRFGSRIAKDEIDEKTFNKYLKQLQSIYLGKKDALPKDTFGWIGSLILDTESPTTQAWLKKYAESNLSYTKDLNIAFNSATQLGAVYTGGKYENLLKNKPRKSLNDDDLGLF